MRPLASRNVWLRVEAVVCLGFSALASLGGLLLTTHWVVTTLKFGSWVPASSFVESAYAVGAGLGVIAAGIMLTTQFGSIASPTALRFARIGLLLGTAAAAVIPEGVLPQLRFNEDFDLSREVLASLLPLVCLGHFIYLGRKHLFPELCG